MKDYISKYATMYDNLKQNVRIPPKRPTLNIREWGPNQRHQIDLVTLPQWTLDVLHPSYDIACMMTDIDCYTKYSAVFTSAGKDVLEVMEVSYIFYVTIFLANMVFM